MFYTGLLQTASMLLKEAQLTPLPSFVAPSSLVQQPFSLDAPPTHFNGLLVEFLDFYLTN